MLLLFLVAALHDQMLWTDHLGLDSLAAAEQKYASADAAHKASLQTGDKVHTR